MRWKEKSFHQFCQVVKIFIETFAFYLKSEYKTYNINLWRAFKTDIHVNNKTTIRTDMHKKHNYAQKDSL
jgi:hypothetical protein